MQNSCKDTHNNYEKVQSNFEDYHIEKENLLWHDYKEAYNFY